MDDHERMGLERERDRLVIAASDMKQAGAAADYLAALGPNMNGDAERVMWTGLVVTYARPFAQSNEIGPVSARLARPVDEAQRTLHDTLCARRNDLAAHNAMTDLRTVTDGYALLGIGAGKFVEEHAPFDPGMLPAIDRLARDQERKFRERLDEIEARLGARRFDPPL